MDRDVGAGSGQHFPAANGDQREVARSSEGRVVAPSDSEWPAYLSELGPHVPPERIYLVGRALPDPEKSIAIVGTRRPTVAGLEIARSFARRFAESGYAVVSGLALGIDAAAHRGALEARGHTVAVLGCGRDVQYLERNRTLRSRIEIAGTIVTEYPDGTPPLSHNFPARNRIIAGLSEGTIVIEGGFKSGALITARLANDAGREVFAVPGSLRNAVAIGPNELIRAGECHIVTDPQQVFDVLGWDAVSSGVDGSGSAVELESDEQQVLFCLDSFPCTMDEICSATRFDPGQVSLDLAKLELRGLARRKQGGFEITEAGARVSKSLLDE